MPVAVENKEKTLRKRVQHKYHKQQYDPFVFNVVLLK